MKFRAAVAEHFNNNTATWWGERVLCGVMFWPMFPLTLAKGSHWLARLLAIVAYPLCFVVNIPFMLAIVLPFMLLTMIRAMWQGMADE